MCRIGNESRRTGEEAMLEKPKDSSASPKRHKIKVCALLQG